MASWRQDYAQTMIGLLGRLDAAEVARIFAELAEVARDQLRRDGIPEAAARFEYLADLRYVGQEHAIAIVVHELSQLTSQCDPLKAAFNVEHAQRYGQSAVDEVLEVVKIRLVVTAPRAESLAESWLTEPWIPEAEVPDQTRAVVFDDAERVVGGARSCLAPILACGGKGRRAGGDRGAEFDDFAASRRSGCGVGCRASGDFSCAAELTLPIPIE